MQSIFLFLSHDDCTRGRRVSVSYHVSCKSVNIKNQGKYPLRQMKLIMFLTDIFVVKYGTDQLSEKSFENGTLEWIGQDLLGLFC